jgi:hypothetical protein
VKKKEETDTKQIPGLSQTGDRVFDFEHWGGNVGNNLTFQLFFSRKEIVYILFFFNYFSMASNNSKVNCKYCLRDITRSFTVECAECENFFLCGDCFSSGVEIFSHKNNHKYKILDCLEIPLFVKDWTVNEELSLLEGI